MTKKPAETASAKSATAEPTLAEEAKVLSDAKKIGNGASAVVAADGRIDEAKNAELATRQAIAEIEAEAHERQLAEVTAEAEAQRAEMVERVKKAKRAEIEAMQRDELKIQKQLELQKEVEAQVAKELENELKSAKAAETDDTWKKDKNAQIDRVFRSNIYKNGTAVREGLITLNRQESTVKGTTISALTIVTDPNHADQYVLKEGAIDYADQLDAFRKLEKLKVVVEIAPKHLGVPWIPESEKRIRALEAELQALIAKR